MATYAIGDVQGCHDELLALLDQIRFDPTRDLLWLTGDLVNRGPKSAQTLRTIRELGTSAVCVLGNHDLHLLAVAEGISKTKHRDTFGDVLGADDREELLDWLRQRPLLHSQDDFTMVHAGLPPDWTLAEAKAHAREVEALLRGPNYREFLGHMYGDEPSRWDENLEGYERSRFIINCLTRLRFLTPQGQLELQAKQKPSHEQNQLIPWFNFPGRKSRGTAIIFGHWSTLGFHISEDTYCLDTGCLWGGELTALRLDRTLSQFSVQSIHGAYQKPTDA